MFGRKKDLAGISCRKNVTERTLNFTGDPDDKEVVQTRKKSNLSKEIRGKAQWIDTHENVDGHYEIYIEDEEKSLAIEYINGSWYWLNHDQGFWWTCQKA